MRLAREGNVVAMFPEGTRRRKGLVKTLRGAPAHGRGADRARGRRAARPGRDRRAPTGCSRLGPLRVAYGAPVELDDLRGGDVREAALEATERLMARIEELEATL